MEQEVIFVVVVNPGAGGNWTPPDDFDPSDPGGNVAVHPISLPMQHFVNELSPSQRSWWMFIASPELKSKISGFLNDNNTEPLWIFDPEAVGFVMEAWVVLDNGGEVDFEKGIIYELKDKPCQSNVLQSIIATSSDLTNLINQTFNSNDQTNLKFSSTDIPNGDPARTDSRPVGSQQSYYISIAFDNTYLDTATDLSITATALHEMVHAYLINLYITGQMSAQSDDYNDLLNAFIAYYDNIVEDTGDTLDNEIHDAMIDFIDQMANSIYNYASTNNIPDVSMDYAKKLAWSTMYGYDLFQQILTPQQQTEYGNIGAVEAYNMQSQNPKGTPCP